MAAGRSMQPLPSGFVQMVMLVTRMLRALGVTSQSPTVRSRSFTFSCPHSQLLPNVSCQLYILLSSGSAPDTFPCSVQKASVSPQKIFLKNYPLPTNSPPKKSKAVLSHIVALKAWKEGPEWVAWFPGMKAAPSCLHIQTLF